VDWCFVGGYSCRMGRVHTCTCLSPLSQLTTNLELMRKKLTRIPLVVANEEGKAQNENLRGFHDEL